MKTLLNHDMCMITESNNELQVKIRMMKGGYVLNRPFPADLRGTIGALTLALDVISGKVILQEVAAPEISLEDNLLEHMAKSTKLIGGKINV